MGSTFEQLKRTLSI